MSRSSLLTLIGLSLLLPLGGGLGLAACESDPDREPVDQTTDDDDDDTTDDGTGGDGDGDTDDDTDDVIPDGDDDGDGIPNAADGTGDADGDGLPNYQDPDSDDDGIPDAEESIPGGTVDSDQDGIPDHVDTDSDNDGLADSAEHNGPDGTPDTGDETDPLDPDSDDDGIMDVVEVAYGSDPNDAGSTVPSDVFYVILPYDAPDHELRDLDFATDIHDADVVIMVDLSGSMIGEHENLKSGINTVIIPNVSATLTSAGFGFVKFGTWDDEDSTYELTQPVTTDAALVQAAVNTITDCGGAEEAHAEALYQAVTGEGLTAKFCMPMPGFGCGTLLNPWYNVNIPPDSCPAGTVGGSCFRAGALPIFIMISDEAFNSGGFASWTWQPAGAWHNITEAIDAMNAIGAKFIGVDSSGSGDVLANYDSISIQTDSVNAADQPFNFEISADGTGLSDAISNAVIDLTQNVQIDVTTERLSVTNPQSVDTTQFIKAITPVSATPSTGVDSFDTTTFLGVDPGTQVRFNVDFHNDFFEPTSPESVMFRATINVVGSGAALDTRDVYIIVPGKGSDVVVTE